MSVTAKPGVEFDPIAPAGYMILDALKSVSESLKLDIVITSGTDGDHSGPFDPHKKGEAYDIRSHSFDDATKHEVLNAIMDLLGRDQFFGFIENQDQPNEHIHLQRRIGTRFTVEDLLDHA